MKSFITKFLYLIGSDRQQLIWVLFFFTLTSLIDALGIGLMAPFVNLSSHPAILEKSALAQSIAQKLNLPKIEYLIAVLGGAIILIFIIQFCLYVIAQNYIFNFVAQLKTTLTVRLSRSYLYAPYIFHLNKNSATIGKNIAIEINTFINQCLSPLMRVLTNTIILFVLLLLLAKTDAIFLGLILLTLIPTIVGFQLLSPKLKEWGKITSVSQEMILKVLNHAFGSVKDTKVIGVEDYFLQQIKSYSIAQSQSVTKFQLTQTLPSFLVKSSLLIFMILFIAIGTVFFEKYMRNVAGIMTVFAVAAIRLIPSVNTIVQGLGQMKNGLYSMDVLYLDLKEVRDNLPADFVGSDSHFTETNQSAIAFQEELRIENLEFAYPNNSKLALDRINLTIKKGESIGFIGKSGSGKTTLVDVILGLLQPQIGDITVDGISIYKNLRAWQNLVGYIPQSIFLTDETIAENIGFGIPQGEIDPDRLTQAIMASQLEDLIEQLPQGLHTPVGERGVRLSGGQRQRIGIARALYHERQILVLDEATSALDNETEQLVSDSIKSLSGQKTLIIIAHRLSTLEHCDRLYVMEQGKIVRSGSYQEIVLNSEEI